MPTDRRVLVIGLDAVSPRVLFSLCKSGRTPTFQRIRKESVSGELISTIPPLSAPAWSSIVTGMNPGKHGVYDFVFDVNVNGKTEVVVHSSKSLRGRAVWDILSRYGKRVIVINVPLTYPPYPVNGLMISGFPAPVNRLRAYPLIVEKKLRRKYPEYKIDIDYLKPDYKGLDEDRFLSEAYKVLYNRFEIVKDLLKEREFDLFFVVFTIPDRIQHVFWGYMDETHPRLKIKNAGKKAKYKDVITWLYVRLDEIVGSLLERAGDNTITFIVSDHGFNSFFKRFGLNNWLSKTGRLEKGRSNMNHYGLVKLFYTRLARLGHLDLNELFQFLPSQIRNMILPSDARAPFFGGIKLHVKSWDEANRRYLRKQVIKDLTKLKDPETGEPFVEKIFVREEIYWGEKLSDAPDLIVVLKSGYKPVKWTKEGMIEPVTYGIDVGSVESGAHTSIEARRGIFFVTGNVINRKITVSAMDIAPTILRILGTKIPESMDGQALDKKLLAGC